MQCNQYTHMVLQQQKWQLNLLHLASHYKWAIKQSIKHHTALTSRLAQAEGTEISLYPFTSGFFDQVPAIRKAVIKPLELRLLARRWCNYRCELEGCWRDVLCANEQSAFQEAASLGKSYRMCSVDDGWRAFQAFNAWRFFIIMLGKMWKAYCNWTSTSCLVRGFVFQWSCCIRSNWK